ncbi:slipin family protein [Nostoc sp. 'Peltigera membranacea cyanobiont' 232]|uniref:slipin family protein n=1 Tax=Nostoc sp. 'Peltigera membranacea cyanobiont' 232 TaxID=2014531 RepID=UPI001CB95E25|nr:slipin family protein [Nostoc sp. 'Peltigera membranacea cyanobiont' 232]
MKTISSYPLFGYQLQAGKLIASTSQSTGNSPLFMQNSVPYYSTNPLLLLMVIIGVGGVLASILSSAIKVANEWERLVVLRLGKFLALKGPGLIFIIPIIDTIPYRIDTRVITASFQAEKTLTKDTVPVDVDAVLFWKVVDPKKAALDVADYKSAISWASQTALRDVIGKTMLSDMLEGREKISKDLQKIIDERTESWGINVISVEVKDVLIPSALEDAMSMQAQAERERQARVILGDSERQVAEKFGEAAKTYINNPVALHLRAMNMLYEGLKENATIVIVPSTAVESMQLGGLAGMTALTMGLGQEKSEIRKQEGIQSMRDIVEPNGTKLIATP